MKLHLVHAHLQQNVKHKVNSCINELADMRKVMQTLKGIKLTT